jgi:hypothetical protein
MIAIEEEETQSEENDDEQPQPVIPTIRFQSKSLTNLGAKDQPINSSADQSSLSSLSTNSLSIDPRPSSALNKRSSNLKKSDTRIKSAKSVSFHLDENQATLDKQDLNETFQEMITSVIPHSNGMHRQNSDLMPDLFKQHQKEITNKPNIGYKMGK